MSFHHPPRRAGRAMAAGIALVALFSLLVPVSRSAAQELRELRFSPGDVDIRDGGAYQEVRLAGWPVDGAPGEPLLPVLPVTVPIPEGTRVARVVVEEAERSELPGTVRPLPAISLAAEGGSERREGNAYAGASEIPRAVLELAGYGREEGEPVAHLLYRGVHWDCRSGALILYPHVRYRLELAPAGTGDGMPAALPARNRAARVSTEPAPSGRTARGGAPGTQFILLHPSQYPTLDGSLVEYLIVSPDSLAEDFQRLADWRTATGTPAAVRTVSEIEAGYPQGVDRAEKIRLFLRDAYTYWGTRWVLLGGDNELIPPRLVHLDYFFLTGEDIVTDVYYSSLDGNWDHDGDGIYGEAFVTGGEEGDWVDFYPEVFVGRAPVANSQEVNIFIDKVIAYQEEAEPSYVRDALFCSEIVFPQDWTVGESFTLNGCDLAHDAGAFLPSSWDTLYLCEWPNQNENLTAVVNAINTGYHLVSVIGHGEAFRWSTGDGRFYRNDNAIAASNDNRFSVFFYANCNTNQFEMECLNEYLLLNPGGGAIATVATTHFDFPDAGRYYQEEFYRLWAQTNVRTLGEIEAGMKIPFIPLSHRDSAHRWTQMAYNVLGDPALPIWRDAPTPMQVAQPGSLALGDETYTLTVQRFGGVIKIPNATVTLWKEDTGEYARGTTDANGDVTLPFPVASLGTVKIGVTHPGHYPAVDSFQVVPGQPVVYLDGVAVDDDSLGSSLGNGNGVFEAGERVELHLTLRNGGADTTSSLLGTLANLPGASITTDVSVDGGSEPGLVMLGQDRKHPASLPFTLGLGSPLDALGRAPYTAEAPGDTAADLQDSSAVRVGGRAYLWEDAGGWHFRAAGALEPHSVTGWLKGDAPFRSLRPYLLESGDVLADAGDSLSFSFAVDSTEAEDGFDLVVADSSFVSVLGDSADYGVIAPGEGVTRTFVVEAAPQTPDAHRVRLDLHAAGIAASYVGDNAVTLDLGAPSLDRVQHAVKDTIAGDGDGLAEPGETVALFVTLHNRGGGMAQGVTGTLHATSGAAVAESVSAWGDLPAGGISANATPFVIAVAESAATFDLELDAGYGLAWNLPFDLGVGTRPPAPTQIKAETGADWIDLRWSPPAISDLRGYNLYQGGGTGTRVNDRLIEGTAYYHIEGLIPETAYPYRVTAVDSAGNESKFSSYAFTFTGPPYQEGWPALARHRVWSAPVVADLFHDGKPEVIVGSRDWRVFAWEADGSDVPGWPQLVGNLADASPAAADLDGDHQLEIITGSDDGKVYAWRADGTGYNAPGGIFASTGAKVRSSPSVADLDGDGIPEIIVGNDAGTLYAWHEDGTGYLNPDGSFASVPGPILSSPSVADVDGDTHPEIFVTSYNGGVYAWNHDGTPFRLADGLFRWIGNGKIWGSPSIGDVDGNGSLEIVVAGGNDSVYVFKTNAQQLPGWPRSTGINKDGSPALGDLDNDGKLEVVVGSFDKNLYVWRYDGTPVSGFPVALGDSIIGSPVIGDITGDDVPEIVVGCADKKIHAYRANGLKVNGWPMKTYARIYSTPAIADLDGDGDVEVICGSFDGFVYCYDLSAAYVREAQDWPMYEHDRMRSGFYGWTDEEMSGVPPEVSAGSVVPAVTRLAAPSPNPVHGGAVLSYDLRAAGEIALALYDVRGRRVRTIAHGKRDAGRYEVQWDGLDAAGKRLGAGVYFLRFTAPGHEETKKLVVAR